MSYRAKGHFPDRADPRDLRVGDLIEAVQAQSAVLSVPEWGPAAPSTDLTHLVGDMWDQTSAEGCVGFGLARSTHMRGLAQGYAKMEPPSPYAFWALARMKEKQLVQPLQNVGCFPRDACDMATKWGLTPWSKWPSEPRFMNVAPTPDMLRAAADYRAASYYSLDGEADLETVLKRALTALVPVNVALMVDHTFNDYSGSHVMPNFDGYQGGTHYVTLIGYQDGAWKICNSWGTDWGFGGFAWITTERLLHPTSCDFRATLVVPDLEES